MPKISSMLLVALLLCGTPALADVADSPQIELQLGLTGGFTHLDAESMNTMGPRIAIGRGWSVIEVQAEYEHLGLYDSGPSGSGSLGTARRLAALGQLDLFALHRGTNSVRYFAEVGVGRQWINRDDDVPTRRHDATVGIGWDIEMQISRGSEQPMVAGLTFVGRVTAAGKRNATPHAPCSSRCGTDTGTHDLGMKGTGSLTLSW